MVSYTDAAVIIPCVFALIYLGALVKRRDWNRFRDNMMLRFDHLDRRLDDLSRR